MNTSLGHIFDSPVEPDSGSALPNVINQQHEPATFVSVIVPVYNDHQGLRRCLAQLEQQTYPRDRFEVIVVDNDSDPGTEIQGVVAQFAQAHYVYEAVPGSYAARNRGIQVARGEAIAFTDADCVPEPDWIAQGLAVLRSHPHCGLVAGKIEVRVDGTKRSNAVQLYESLTALTQKKFVEQDHYGATANVLTWRHVIEAVGCFDQTLKSSGDVEWGQRVYGAGYQQVYAPQARVSHPARASFAQLRQQAIRHAGGFYDLQQKRCGSSLEKNLAFLKLLLFHLMPPLFFAWRALLNSQFMNLGQKLKVIWVMCFVRCTIVRELFRLRLGGISFRG